MEVSPNAVIVILLSLQKKSVNEPSEVLKRVKYNNEFSNLDQRYKMFVSPLKSTENRINYFLFATVNFSKKQFSNGKQINALTNSPPSSACIKIS